MADVRVKGTRESLVFDIDFSQRLAAGETIQSVTSIMAEPDTTPSAVTFGATVTNGSPVEYDEHTAPTGTVVQVLIGGGSILPGQESRDYIVRCLVDGSVSPAIEAAVILRVDDTPNP